MKKFNTTLKEGKMMKKLFAIMLVIVLMATCVACAPKDEKKDVTVYALTPTEDHGWTGSIATFAKQEVDKINADGKYQGKLLTAEDATAQIQQIEDLLANNKPDEFAVSMLPYDDTLEAAVKQLIDAGVPVIMVDRIITSQADKATANVKGDNEGTGAAAAWYCVEKGLTPDQRVYVVEGDSSSVNVARTDGFTDYLLGKVEYKGKIATPWTEAQVKDNIIYSGVTGWSQATAQGMFETLLSDSANADIKYVVSWDSGTALGVVDALAGSAIDEATKTEFLANKPYICGCSGHPDLYALLAGTSTDEAYKDIYDQLGGMMYTTYEPGMMGDGVELMVKYLNGETITKDFVIPTEVVTKDNYADFSPFF